MRLEKIETWPQKLKLYQVAHVEEIEGHETEFIWDAYASVVLVFKNPGNLTLEQLIAHVEIESEKQYNRSVYA